MYVYIFPLPVDGAKRNFKMRLLRTTIFLSCFMMLLINGESRFKQYCYDPPSLSCAVEHILDCREGQVITTDIPGFRVSFIKNRNYSACQIGEDECKNKTTCCKYISNDVTKQEIRYLEGDVNLLIKFIKTECASKSSCIVSSYYNTSGGSDLYDYATYNYGCIPEAKEITVDFLVNGSTKFTGSRIPTVYYMEYTGSGTTDNDVIINRECIVTTTEKDITLTIKELNLQADDCCRFHISRYNVTEYCTENGSSTPPNSKYINKDTATIRLENIVNKDGDSFSILVRVAGNVTIECREITNLITQELTNCQHPTVESSTLRRSSSTVVPSTNTIGIIPPKTEERKKEDSETNLPGIIGGTVGGLVVLVLIIIVVVVILRRRRRPKHEVGENNYLTAINYNVKENPTSHSNSGYTYIDIDLTKSTTNQ